MGVIGLRGSKGPFASIMTTCVAEYLPAAS